MASIHLDLYLDHSMIHNFFTVMILYMTHLLRQMQLGAPIMSQPENGIKVWCNTYYSPKINSFLLTNIKIGYLTTLKRRGQRNKYVRPKIFLVFRNNAYMPYISSTLDGKRQTIIQDPLLHTSLLDSLNSLVVNDADYSLKLDRNEYFLLYFF